MVPGAKNFVLGGPKYGARKWIRNGQEIYGKCSEMVRQWSRMVSKWSDMVRKLKLSVMLRTWSEPVRNGLIW